MRIKRLNDNATIPSRGSITAAGYDLYASLDCESITIPPHETILIDTGWAMEIPVGYFGAIFARSGLAAKQGLRPANCVGIIDSDYRGPVKVALHNDSAITQIIKNKDRIAQLVIIKYFGIDFEIVNELSKTTRGTGGFGSTGQ